MVELRIECPPVSWLSHGGYGKRSYNRRAAEKLFYQTQWKRFYHQNNPIPGPVCCTYIFAFPVPSSLSAARKTKMLSDKVLHTKRPDLSNCIKFCEDTLKEIVIVDDSQVVRIEATKIYSEEPYTLIQIIPV